MTAQEKIHNTIKILSQIFFIAVNVSIKNSKVLQKNGALAPSFNLFVNKFLYSRIKFIIQRHESFEQPHREPWR